MEKNGSCLKTFGAIAKAVTDAALYFNTGQQMPMRYNWQVYPSLQLERPVDYMVVSLSGLTSLSILFVTYMAYASRDCHLERGCCDDTPRWQQLKLCMYFLAATSKSFLKAGSLGLLFVNGRSIKLASYIFAVISWFPVGISEYMVLSKVKLDCLKKGFFCMKLSAGCYAVASAALYFMSADSFLEHIGLESDRMTLLLSKKFSWGTFSYVFLNGFGALSVMPAQYHLVASKIRHSAVAQDSQRCASLCQFFNIPASLYKGIVPSSSLTALFFSLYFSVVDDFDTVASWAILGSVGLLIAGLRIFAEYGFFNEDRDRLHGVSDDYQAMPRPKSSLQNVSGHF